MIRVTDLKVEGSTPEGSFEGNLSLRSGLNVISAENGYGKSLAGIAIPWCLGAEAMFGLQDNDPSRFPEAVRDIIELRGRRDLPVISASCSIRLQRDDGESLLISRPIHGLDQEIVEVLHVDSQAETIGKYKLRARRETLKDDTGGLQSFLFRWMGLRRHELVDRDGRPTEIYLENLLPLLYIDQGEGWVDIQSLQVFRYRQLDIKEASFEYLLGATEALEARHQAQRQLTQEQRRSAAARAIADRVTSVFYRRGYSLDWSDHGSAARVAKRWKRYTLAELAKRQFDLDLPGKRRLLERRASRLKRKLRERDVSDVELADGERASQRVVELKTKRHELRLELRRARIQLTEQSELLSSVENRLRSSRDVLRLKEAGIGRMQVVECPTCHREVSPESFHLTQQAKSSVAASIAALERDRNLVTSNIRELTSEERRISANLENLEEELRNAQRALLLVNEASSTVTEQLAKAAADILEVERDLDRTIAFEEEIAELQDVISDWVAEVEREGDLIAPRAVSEQRVEVFLREFRERLLAWGHSAVSESNAVEVDLDDQYTPYLGRRRLRSLGSASDHPRLVAAFVLALAAAGAELGAPHPGFVILDEPLQQNPDTEHRERFISYLLEHGRADQQDFQTVIFTYLRADEVVSLEEAGLTVDLLEGHFLVSEEGGRKLTEPSDSVADAALDPSSEEH